MNKLSLPTRRGYTSKFTSLSGIDFVQINYGEYQVLLHAHVFELSHP